MLIAYLLARRASYVPRLDEHDHWATRSHAASALPSLTHTGTPLRRSWPRTAVPIATDGRAPMMRSEANPQAMVCGQSMVRVTTRWLTLMDMANTFATKSWRDSPALL